MWLHARLLSESNQACSTRAAGGVGGQLSEREERAMRGGGAEHGERGTRYCGRASPREEEEGMGGR